MSVNKISGVRLAESGIVERGGLLNSKAESSFVSGDDVQARFQQIAKAPQRKMMWPWPEPCLHKDSCPEPEPICERRGDCRWREDWLSKTEKGKTMRLPKAKLQQLRSRLKKSLVPSHKGKVK